MTVPNPPDGMVAVRALTAAEAVVVLGLLQAMEIPAALQPLNSLPAVYGTVPTAMRLYVAADRVEEAVALLAREGI